jgi:CheY-like chemotaxis protein
MGTVLSMNGQFPAPMRLVIVDDHQMVLDGLKAMLGPYREQVQVVGEASDPGGALSLVTSLNPDAVLLDVRLRGASGLDLCGDILAARRGTAQADPRRRAGRLPAPHRRRRGAHRPGAGGPGGAVRGPAAQR